MTIKSIRTGWTGISALAGNDQWFSDFESIASVTVGAGGAADIEFTSIPSTYQHLQIRALGRTDRSAAGDYIEFQVNGITTSSYSAHQLLGYGSTVSSVGSASQTFIEVQRFAADSATANIFGAFITDILDYKDTNKNTTIRTLGGADSNGDGIIALTSGAYLGTAAISSIKLLPGVGTNFKQYSHFALYGIRG